MKIKLIKLKEKIILTYSLNTKYLLLKKLKTVSSFYKTLLILYIKIFIKYNQNLNILIYFIKYKRSFLNKDLIYPNKEKQYNIITRK